MAHEAIVLEEENTSLALPRVSGDANLVAQRFAAASEPVMKLDFAAKHAINAFAAHVKVDAQPGD